MKTQIETWRLIVRIVMAIATAVLGVFSEEREA